MPLALLALTLSAFAIGTTEFVIVGLLPTASDLAVDLPSAGLLISLYAFEVLAAVLLMLSVTASNPWLTLLIVLLWGAVAFGNVPGLQLYVVRLAERYVPQAVDVASGLNIAAFNLGIAGGAWAGGLIVANLGLIHTPWIGALIVVLALLLTAWSGRLDRRDPDVAQARPAGTELAADPS